MKLPCLSLWQPYASVIFQLDHNQVQIKKDETRHWPTNVRGRIFIHAAKSLKGREDHDPNELAAVGLKWANLPFGAVIGTVEIVDCHHTDLLVTRAVGGHLLRSKRSEVQLNWGDYSYGRYAFELAKPTLLPHPVPFTGRQSFFGVQWSELTQILLDRWCVSGLAADRRAYDETVEHMKGMA